MTSCGRQRKLEGDGDVFGARWISCVNKIVLDNTVVVYRPCSLLRAKHHTAYSQMENRDGLAVNTHMVSARHIGKDHRPISVAQPRISVGR